MNDNSQLRPPHMVNNVRQGAVTSQSYLRVVGVSYYHDVLVTNFINSKLVVYRSSQRWHGR